MLLAIRDVILLRWFAFLKSRTCMYLMRPVIIAIITMKAIFLRQRMSHENGFVTRGSLRIVDDVDLPPNEFFQPGRAFSCRLRHACVSFLDDAGLVVRGAALKFADAPIDSPLDLLMNTGVAAPFWNMDTFWQFTVAKAIGGRARLLPYFRKNPRCYMNVCAGLRRNPTSFAHQEYNSQTPLQFVSKDGRERYAKFRLVPLHGAPQPPDGLPEPEDLETPWFQEALSHEIRTRNYLKAEYRDRLKHEPVRYSLQIQLLEWREAYERDVELNSLFPWDEQLAPWRRLAEVTITDSLSYHEGNLCYFSITHLPDALKVIPAKGYQDGPSIDFLRLAGVVPRRVRLWMYSILGQPAPIPNERPETAVDYADQTTSIIISQDICTTAMLLQQDSAFGQRDRVARIEAAKGTYQFAHGFVRTEATTSGARWIPPDFYEPVFPFYNAAPASETAVPIPLPPFIRDLPAAEKYSVYIAGRLYKVVGASLMSLLLSTVENWWKNRHGLNAYRHLFFGYREKPSVLKNNRWREDAEFARQRVAGINPSIIRRFDAIPDKFPVTDTLLAGLLDPGETIESAIAGKRLYYCDYAILEGISVHEDRYLATPISLFYVGASGKLMPVAIQLVQNPDDGPIFTPKDDPGLWLAVKTYTQSADAQIHEVVEHLLHGHLIIEIFDLAMHRALPQAHPIHQLLLPHLEFTMAVNDSARRVMLAPGGPIDRTMAIGAKGSFELLARAWWEKWDFSGHNIALDLKERGVDDRVALPDYPWRDDALRIWDIVERYVTEMVDQFYASDQDVAQDREIQAFHAELVSQIGGDVRGLPGGAAGLQAKSTLIELLTRTIYSASAGHAAGNNGQYDMYGFIPNVPGAMYRPPPRDRNLPWTENDLVAALPDFRSASVQVLMVRLLSRPTDMPLGHFEQNFFAGNDEVWPIVRRFRLELYDLSQEIRHRNEKMAMPYAYLDPRQVACSITA